MSWDHVRYRLLFQVSALRSNVAQALRDAGALLALGERVANVFDAIDDDDRSVAMRFDALDVAALQRLEYIFRCNWSLTLCWGPLNVSDRRKRVVFFSLSLK